jgi:uncharacterized protein (TIGR02271 family)
VDLGKFFHNSGMVCAYTFAEIDSPEAADAKLFTGSDDQIAVWLNGSKLYDFGGSRGYEPDKDEIPLHLVAGKNRLLLKIGNVGGTWEFGARLPGFENGKFTPRKEAAPDEARREPTGMNHETAARHAPAAAGRGAAAQPESSDAQRQSVLRSEERLRADIETVETGRVRLRKYVVTSEQKITVPIRHEEVHVTREPVTSGEARTDAEIGEEECEVILHEERPVVVKEIVPVERVSLDTTTIRENREVSDTVRREEVEIDDGTKAPRR